MSEMQAAPAEGEELEIDGTIETGEIDEGEGQQQTEDSAPSLDDSQAEGQEKADPVQQRINKLVGQRSQAERERDEAKKELEELKANQAPADKPKLADFDYDEDKYQEALIEWKVDQKLQVKDQKQQQDSAKTERELVVNTFNDRAAKLAEKDPKYFEKLNAIPTLPPETLDTLMRHEKGAEIAGYLGSHLDIATDLAGMNPNLAAVKIGELSAQLATKQTVETSAAPEPIDTIDSGASLGGDEWSKVGEGATFE